LATASRSHPKDHPNRPDSRAQHAAARSPACQAASCTLKPAGKPARLPAQHVATQLRAYHAHLHDPSGTCIRSAMRSCSASGAEHAPSKPFTPGPTGSRWCRRTAVTEQGLLMRNHAAGGRRGKLSASGPTARRSGTGRTRDPLPGRPAEPRLLGRGCVAVAGDALLGLLRSALHASPNGIPPVHLRALLRVGAARCAGCPAGAAGAARSQPPRHDLRDAGLPAGCTRLGVRPFGEQPAAGRQLLDQQCAHTL